MSILFCKSLGILQHMRKVFTLWPVMDMQLFGELGKEA